MTSFNAWTQPWLPVRRRDGAEETLSLRETFLRAHDLAGLGSGFTPLDLDSLYRFLPSIAAVIARGIRDEDWTDQWETTAQIPGYAIDAFGATFEARFDVFGDRPFLQRWDRTPADVHALVGPKKTLLDVAKPIEQMHPHQPGDSSSKWSIRRDTRLATDPASLTMLLVTAWFQTKNGNGNDPWGGKVLKGSAGTWHTNPLAVHYTDPQSLARTIFANVPDAWLDRDDLPLFLDHTSLPDDFATAHKESVTRFTYDKTLPLIVVADGAPVGFVLGADETITTPTLAADDKASLGAVHEHDHTRLYLVTRKRSKQGTEEVILAPRGSFGARLSSTEGFERWFRADNNISFAFNAWRNVRRVVSVSNRDEADWNVSMLSETTDGKGSRIWAAWDEMPLAFAGAEGATLSGIQELLAFASRCRGNFASCGRTATGDSKIPPLAVVGQAAFYTGLVPIISDFAAAVSTGEEPALRDVAEQIARLAVREFEVTTDPLLTPSRIAAVAKARADFRRFTYSAFRKSYPTPATPADTQEVA